MKLPNISNEQLEVVNKIKDNNVIVESVAGSGKTTCNLYVAQTYPDKSILLLTYNAKLKIETRERVDKLGLTNIETHSYHSFCVKYYNRKCFTDYQIISVVNCDSIPLKHFSYDIVILDESQDMSPLYFELVCKILKDNNKQTQICLLGDRAQSIYDFNRADARFLIFADKLFKNNDLPWTNCKLSESYRITKEMADFVNHCMFGKQIIKSNKIAGIKPKYIVTNVYDDTTDSRPFNEVKNLLKQYKPEEIFILAPSVRSEKTPVRQLENLIKTALKNVPVYVPVSDEEKLDEEVLRNKLVFSTFHQAKGLERKVVLVYNFDDSYFRFYKKDKDPKVCPNELYVASTRALEQIIFIHDHKNDYLPFITKMNLSKYTNLIQDEMVKPIKYQEKKVNETSVTELIKHLPIDVLSNCKEYLEITQIKDKSDMINIPFKMEQSMGFESVGEITGIAIPSYLEFKTSNKMSIYSEVIKNSKQIEHKLKGNVDNDEVDFIDSDENDEPKPQSKTLNQTYSLDTIKLSTLKPDELLYIANYYCSMRSGFLYKIHQVTNYNWLSQENLDACIERLVKIGISKKAQYEQYVERENLPELLNRRFTGYIDCIDQNNVYEFKCVEKIENEHILQLAIYMYLHQTEIKNKKSVQYIPGNTSSMPGLVKDFISCIEKNNREIASSRDPSRVMYLMKLNEKLLVQVDNLMKNTKQNKPSNTEPEITNYNYYLYNILSDELLQISCPYEKLVEMVKYLMYSKYIGSKEIPDEIFIKNGQNIMSKYLTKIISQPEKPVENIISYKSKKYLQIGNQIYFVNKHGIKGPFYGYMIDGKIVKTKTKELIV